MPQAAVEQVFYRAGGCAASLRGTGAPCRDHPGGIPHCPLLPLELWGLSLRMLPLLWIGMLFFLTFIPRPRPGGRQFSWSYADAAQAVCFGPVRRSLTGGVLLSLLCMGEAAVFYSRMFGWYGWGSLLLPALATLLPALCSHWGAAGCWGRSGPGWCMCGWRYPSCVWPCRCPTPWESGTDIFSASTSSTWYFRPRLLYAGRNSDRSVHTVGRGHRPVDGSPRTIQKIISGRSLNDWR